MSKIVFNDGTEIENALVSSYMLPEKLACEIPGNNIVDAIMLFNNKNKTCKIEYYNMNLFKNTYINFTVIEDVSILHNTGMVRVVLTGDGEKETEVINGYSLPDEYIPGALAEEIFSNQREEEQNNEH